MNREATTDPSPSSATTGVTSLLGLAVVTRAGVPVGRIADVMIEPLRGMIAYVLVELAHSGRTCAVPYGSLRFHAGQSRMVLDVGPGVLAAGASGVPGA